MAEADEAGKVTILGRIKEKLVERKQDWARDGRLLTGKYATPEQRLPPGQRLVRDWPVLDLGLQPEVALASFRLDLDGAVGHAHSFSWEAFLALPQVEAVCDIHCVTQWSRYDNHWKGVAAHTLVELVAPSADVAHIVCHSYDGYTTNVRFDQFDQPDVFLVHQWEGKPLPREHGGPLRMLIPRLYFWKSAKWLRRIEFVAVDRPGFWEVRGYHNNADPWREERYS
ncbi:MAG: sulfite oxidase-like oxidoreductase [Acetobacteraceae bacterium]